MSIILNELDPLLIGLCDLESDYSNLMRTNKHYQDLISRNNLFMEWKIYRSKHKYEFKEKEKSLIYACSLGLLLFSKYLVKKYVIDIHYSKEKAFVMSCENGHINMAMWLFDLSNQPGYTLIDIHDEYEYAFRVSCGKGHLNIAKWLIELSRQSSKLIDIHVIDEYAFRYSCETSHLNVAQWLIDLSREPGFSLIDIHACNDAAFNWSCLKGRVNVAEWLIDLSKQPGFTLIDIHARNENAFVLSCREGHINMAQWLFDLSRGVEIRDANLQSNLPFQEQGKKPRFTLIDIHAGNEDAFRLACKEGHINVAKWLIELSKSNEAGFRLINIHAQNDYAFVETCTQLRMSKAHIDTAKWLIELGKQQEFTPIPEDIIAIYSNIINPKKLN